MCENVVMNYVSACPCLADMMDLVSAADRKVFDCSLWDEVRNKTKFNLEFRAAAACRKLKVVDCSLWDEGRLSADKDLATVT
jgi:hypothetical protein